MRIEHLKFDPEMCAAVMHGVKRKWDKKSSSISMIVLGVSQSTVEAFVINSLKTPGICDNIIAASITHPIDAIKKIQRSHTTSVVHIHLMDDLVYIGEKFSKPAFEGIMTVLIQQKPQNVYLYGDKDVATLFMEYGIAKWVESQYIEIGIDNLISNFSIPDFPDSESLASQRPDNLDHCSEFFVGDKYLSYRAAEILLFIETIFNRCPKSNIRVVVSPKMARKLYKESMHY